MWGGGGGVKRGGVQGGRGVGWEKIGGLRQEEEWGVGGNMVEWEMYWGRKVGLGCSVFRFGRVSDPVYLGFSVFWMQCIADAVCLGTSVFGIQCVWDPGCLGSSAFGIQLVWAPFCLVSGAGGFPCVFYLLCLVSVFYPILATPLTHCL